MRTAPYRTLMTAILERGYTCQDLAALIGIHKVTMSRKVHGQVPWTLDEIYDILAVLGETPACIPTLFPPRRKEDPHGTHDH